MNKVINSFEKFSRLGKCLRNGLAVAVALVGGSQALAQDVTLKFHHIWPAPAMAPVKLITPWCEKVAAESNNRIKCQMLPAMSGGGTPAQLVDRVKDGVDDLVVTLPGYTPGRFPALEVFELPFMTNTAEPASRAVWEYFQKHSVKEFPGTKILAAWVHDEGYVHTRDRAVKTLADFKGLKMRAPTRQTAKLLTALGASTVGMPITGVADALGKGTIDGMLVPWEIIPSFKLQELVKFHSETDPSRGALYSAVFVFAMNQARYDSLPADLKAVIDRNSGMDLSAKAGKIWDESQAAGRKSATDRNNSIYLVPAAEVDNWIKASAPVFEDWTADLDKKGYNGKALLKEARDLIARNSKK